MKYFHSIHFVDRLRDKVEKVKMPQMCYWSCFIQQQKW